MKEGEDLSFFPAQPPLCYAQSKESKQDNLLYSWAIVVTWFEPVSSGVGSDRSANHVSTIAQEYIKFVLFTFLTLPSTHCVICG